MPDWEKIAQEIASQAVAAIRAERRKYRIALGAAAVLAVAAVWGWIR